MGGGGGRVKMNEGWRVKRRNSKEGEKQEIYSREEEIGRGEGSKAQKEELKRGGGGRVKMNEGRRVKREN